MTHHNLQQAFPVVQTAPSSHCLPSLAKKNNIICGKAQTDFKFCAR